MRRLEPVLAVLAGGTSTRMGRDKAGLPIDGTTLLARTVAVGRSAGLRTLVIGRGAPPGWPADGTVFLADSRPGHGPLPALANAVLMADAPVVLVACDMPWLTPTAVRWLVAAWIEQGAVHGLITTHRGRPQPLFAVYAPACRDLIGLCLHQGRQSLLALVECGAFGSLPVPADHVPAVQDIDTPEDYQRFLDSA